MNTPLNRRNFLSSASLAVVSGLTLNIHKGIISPLFAERQTEFQAATKKGFCYATKSDPNWSERLTKLNAHWFYTWGPELPSSPPEGIEFVPMIWGKQSAKNESLLGKLTSQYQAGEISALLGFNEPDQAKQANMSVEDVLDAWPALMELGIPLGSPGCVHPDRDWMKDFMKGVEERKLRVDFVCAHSYGGPNAKGLINRMKQVYEMFGRPIWITEFAVGDWAAADVSENKHSPEVVAKFMKEVIPLLNKSQFVHRYAWYSAKLDNRALGTSALFDDEGNLTDLGKLYSKL